MLPRAVIPRRVWRDAGWIASMLLLTLMLWLDGLAGLLTLANRDHVDIPPLLAEKLPLLHSRPGLVFAGESRTEFGVDPELAENILGARPGAAVNIAYDAGDPLAFAAATALYPEAFRQAHVVLSVAPFIFNEGVRQASVYPLAVTARLGVREQLIRFLPLRIGTLIRYIRDAFAARVAEQQGIAIRAAAPPHGGLGVLDRIGQTTPDLGHHPFYAGWDLSGPKTKFEIEGLCRLAAASARLTVVDPPWIPEDRSEDRDWVRYEDEMLSVLREVGQRCGFDVLHITSVPGLTAADFADEMHVNGAGIPIYTRYLMTQIKP